jgi:hypothetical protein
MKRAFKISLVLLLTGVAGYGHHAANNAENNITVDPIVKLLNDKDKKTADKDQSQVGKPFFRTQDAKVSVNMLNMDGTPVEVNVYDEYDRVLFNEIISGENSVGKQFDFSKAADGIYTIVVKDECKQYYKTIEKF